MNVNSIIILFTSVYLYRILAMSSHIEYLCMRIMQTFIVQLYPKDQNKSISMLVPDASLPQCLG